jgi:dTDP-4-amino-4,6-dideoxygalactose transaminase
MFDQNHSTTTQVGKQYRIWLSPPHIVGNELMMLDAALRSGWLAPAGPQLQAFEQAISEYSQCQAVAVHSGTAALHMAYRLAGVEAGDEVICPSLSYIATVAPLLQMGGVPVFIDSEKENHHHSFEHLRRAIEDRIRLGKRPKAVLLVHLYGACAELEQTLELCHEYDIQVIEDAAEGFGARYQGQPLGSFGRYGIFSFNGNKLMTTGGGGALLCQTPEEADHARYLASHARLAAPYYLHAEVGYNYRMGNLTAALGLAQLENLDLFIARRTTNNKRYQANLGNIEGLTFTPPRAGCQSTHWLTTIQIDPELAGVTRESVRLSLDAASIQSRPVWKPMHTQPLFEDCIYYGEGNSERLFEQGLCLPSGSNLSEAQVDEISAMVRATFVH